MKLTAPIHVLKGKAKELKRSQAITMAEALNQIAKAEGFDSWSLLQSKVKTFVPRTSKDILDYLHPGDLLLIAARPGLGKTTLTLQLLLEAIKEKRGCFLFSLEYTQKMFSERLATLDPKFEQNEPLLQTDFSDEISSDYIIKKTKDAVTEGALIAIDYLQLLDQKRSKPHLQKQVEDLKKYAKEKKCILVFISQIDRAFDQKDGHKPSMEDIRLPNPLDLSLFNKTIFVKNGQIHI